MSALATRRMTVWKASYVEALASSQQSEVLGQVEAQEAAFRLVVAVPWARVVGVVVRMLVGEAVAGKAVGQEV